LRFIVVAISFSLHTMLPLPANIDEYIRFLIVFKFVEYLSSQPVNQQKIVYHLVQRLTMLNI